MAEKAFKFRLQAVLDYKQELEDREKEKLAKILAELRQAIEYKRQLEEMRAQAREELKEKQRAGEVDINLLQFYTHYLKKLDKDIVQAALEVEKIKAREREQRQALLRAAIERRTYERLKEKHKEVFDAEMAEIERKLIDELATIKAARRSMEEKLERDEALEAEAGGGESQA